MWSVITSRPAQITRRIALLVSATGVMNVIVPAVSRQKKGNKMKTFTIDADNSIAVFVSPEEAAATTTTPFDTFASQQELASLIGQWPAERLLATWNSLPGVTPVKKFKNGKTAAGKIWARIQGLGEPPKPKAERTAKGGARMAKGAPVKGKATKRRQPPRRRRPKAASAPNRPKPLLREGSKTAQVVAMLQRKDGATLAEIMEKVGWQKHTVRGLMDGAMKKAGHAVESFKPENGERTYRINK